MGFLDFLRKNEREVEVDPEELTLMNSLFDIVDRDGWNVVSRWHPEKKKMCHYMLIPTGAAPPTKKEYETVSAHLEKLNKKYK